MSGSYSLESTLKRETVYTVWYKLTGSRAWVADRDVRTTDADEAREIARKHAAHPAMAEVQITGKDSETFIQVYAEVVK